MNTVETHLESLLRDNDLPIFMKLLPEMELFRSIREKLVCWLLYSIYATMQSNRL